MVAIPTRTLFNSWSTTSLAGDIPKHRGDTVYQEVEQSTTIELSKPQRGNKHIPLGSIPCVLISYLQYQLLFC